MTAMSRFNSFYVQAFPSLCSFANRLCHNPCTAEELVQTAGMKVFQNYLDKTEREWLPLMYRITYREFVSMCRKKSEEPMPEAGFEPAVMPDVDGTSDMDEFIRSIDWESAMFLQLWEIGMSQEEISHIMEISNASVSRMKYRSMAIYASRRIRTDLTMPLFMKLREAPLVEELLFQMEQCFDAFWRRGMSLHEAMHRVFVTVLSNHPRLDFQPSEIEMLWMWVKGRRPPEIAAHFGLPESRGGQVHAKLVEMVARISVVLLVDRRLRLGRHGN